MKNIYTPFQPTLTQPGLHRFELNLQIKTMAIGVADGMVIHNNTIIYQASDLRVGLINSNSA
ncbi:MAG TPA: hypothetical protein ENJ28_06425 [Gammaproteobacteria bacterium]|nr:hypothetical protein [Gammaproteobacteria bacterium]